jgi:hypothetical protein
MQLNKEIIAFRKFISCNIQKLSSKDLNLIGVNRLLKLDYDTTSFKEILNKKNEFWVILKEKLNQSIHNENIDVRLIDFTDISPLLSLKFCLEDNKSTSQVFLNYSFWFQSFCIVFYDGNSKSRIINFNGGDYFGFSFLPETEFHKAINDKVLSIVDNNIFQKLSPEILNICVNNILIDKTYYQNMSVFDLLYNAK